MQDAPKNFDRLMKTLLPMEFRRLLLAVTLLLALPTHASGPRTTTIGTPTW